MLNCSNKQLAPKEGKVRTLVHLRWFFLGVLLATMALLGGTYVAVQAPFVQVSMFGEPNYLSLFSRVVADYIYDEHGQPVGVFADEDLAGCDLRRNNIHITMPPGLPPEPVDNVQFLVLLGG